MVWSGFFFFFKRFTVRSRFKISKTKPDRKTVLKSNFRGLGIRVGQLLSSQYSFHEPGCLHSNLHLHFRLPRLHSHSPLQSPSPFQTSSPSLSFLLRGFCAPGFSDNRLPPRLQPIDNRVSTVLLCFFECRISAFTTESSVESRNVSILLDFLIF